jgi:hypothetical protein
MIICPSLCIYFNFYKNNLISYELIYNKMKKPSTCRSLIFLILSMSLSYSALSQNFIPVKGTGPSVDKTINVSGFNAIDVSGGFDVILVQGNTESLTLTAQENLFEYITARVENGTLKIYTHHNIWSTRPMKARISFKDMKGLKVSGGGDMYSETPINTEALEVSVSGGGDFRSEINTEQLKCQISGGGDADVSGKINHYYTNISGGGDLKSKVSAGEISCRMVGGGDIHLMNDAKASKAEIEISGGGDLEMKMNAERLRCSIGGGGDALISGQASDFDLHINGGGDVDAKNLLTGTTSVTVGGGSDIHVNVSQELSGSISGGGDLYYTGNPARISVDARGGSKVHKE